MGNKVDEVTLLLFLLHPSCFYLYLHPLLIRTLCLSLILFFLPLIFTFFDLLLSNCYSACDFAFVAEFDLLKPTAPQPHPLDAKPQLYAVAYGIFVR